jgi:hypothetical protein
MDYETVVYLVENLIDNWEVATGSKMVALSVQLMVAAWETVLED